jgi:hypothetical protein
MTNWTSRLSKATPGLLLLSVSACLYAQTGAPAANSTKMPPPKFQVCKAYFALCTTATCTAQGTGYACGNCIVKSGYSAGLATVACSDLPQKMPLPGTTLYSRYSPITSYVACENSLPWAMCLDATCTVNSDRKTATCACTSGSGEPYVYVTPSWSAAGCNGSEVISSVTAKGDNSLQTITDYLKDNKHLPALPIKVLPPPVH